MKVYPTELNCFDFEVEVEYFNIKMFDDQSAVIKSDVCIGSIDELDEYLSNIRKAFMQMFPEWDEVEKC